jgi:predicted enzyme involved in methoxymalonyl-ACP biosynthesis
MCSDLGLFISEEHRKDIKTPIKILKFAESWAKERDVQEMFFGNTVNVKNSKVKAFYERLGFDTVGNIFKKRVN